MVTISDSRNGGEPARKAQICLDRSMEYPTHLVKGRDDFEERLFDDPAHYRYDAIASESGLVRPRKRGLSFAKKLSCRGYIQNTARSLK
jgi:hypothetical protein